MLLRRRRRRRAAACVLRLRRAPKALIVSNSLSYLDALLLTASLGPLKPSHADGAASPAGIAPALAWLLCCARATGAAAAPHPPSSSASPRPSVCDAVVPHASHDGGGMRVLSFPEGRRTVGGCLAPFAPSSFATRLGPSAGSFAPLVQPVAISYVSGNSFNTAFVPLSSSHPSLLPTLFHAFQLTAAWMKEGCVAILAPINSTGAQDASVESVAAAATTAIAASLGWPLVESTGNDGSYNNTHHYDGAAAKSPPGSPRAPGRRAAGGRSASAAAVSPPPPVNAGGRTRRAAAATAASPGFGGSPGTVRRSTHAAAKRGDE